MKVFGFNLTRAAAIQPEVLKKGKRATGMITPQQPDRVSMEMDRLKSAIDSALDINNPDRRDLLAIYEATSKDSHVISQMEIAYNKVVSQPFILSKDGRDDAEATKLLAATWFEDFIKAIISEEFWGFTMVEFDLQDENGQFTGCDIFPRRNVLPFKYAICFDSNSPNGKGIYFYEAKGDGSYIDRTKELYLIDIGKPDRLGKFETIAREVVWKNFANTDWSQGSEKFGMPLLDIATESDDPQELNRLEQYARGFGSNGWLIRGKGDEVNIIQPAGRDFYQIYDRRIAVADEQISKCINGATGQSDQQAYVGAAEVQERTTADFHYARMRKITNVVNQRLIHFLVYHGYPLEGYQFRYLAFDPNPEPGTLNPEPETLNPKSAKPKKASASLRPW